MYLGCGDSQGVGSGVEQEGEKIIGMGVRDGFEDGAKVGSRGNKVGPKGGCRCTCRFEAEALARGKVKECTWCVWGAAWHLALA